MVMQPDYKDFDTCVLFLSCPFGLIFSEPYHICQVTGFLLFPGVLPCILYVLAVLESSLSGTD